MPISEAMPKSAPMSVNATRLSIGKKALHSRAEKAIGMVMQVGQMLNGVCGEMLPPHPTSSISSDTASLKQSHQESGEEPSILP